MSLPAHPLYPTKPGATIVWSAETRERHGYLSASGITREFDHVYRYVIDSDGWLFHRLLIDEFGRTLGRAFRWQRSSHGDPAVLVQDLFRRWALRQVSFTVHEGANGLQI